MNNRKIGVTTVFGAAFVCAAAFAAQPDGLYSADQLLDADVYANGSNEQVGEVDDILLNNDMRIQSFIIETDSQFGLGGKSYVVNPDQLSVETMAGDKATEPEYRITLDADSGQLKRYPEYNDAWWTRAQRQASDAWAQTRESAADAWTSLKKGTNNLIDRAQGQTPRDAGNADDTGTVIHGTDDGSQNTGD